MQDFVHRPDCDAEGEDPYLLFTVRPADPEMRRVKVRAWESCRRCHAGVTYGQTIIEADAAAGEVAANAPRWVVTWLHRQDAFTQPALPM